MADLLLIYITCADKVEAKRLGRLAVEGRLAACANIIPGMKSIYRWQGEVTESQEAVLILKTTAARFPRLREALVAAHSYEVPCVVALPIAAGHQPYLDWLEESVGGD
jgi:periplasmic divalent cation tolerance protein